MDPVSSARMFEGVSFDTFGDFINELFSITPYLIPAALGYLGFRKAVRFFIDVLKNA